MPAACSFRSSFMPFMFCMLVPSTSGETFLKLQTDIGGTSSLGAATTEFDAESSLLQELQLSFRPGAKKDHIMTLEAQIKPMFKALPKIGENTIPQEVVRYVLHRFFIQRGWFIQGLQPLVTSPTSDPAAGFANNTNQTMQVVQQWAPAYLYKFLEELHGGKSITERELAILAATFEDLAHKEALSGLDNVQSSLFLRRDSYDQEDVKEVLAGYMLGFHYNYKPSDISTKALRLAKRDLKDWHHLQEWTQNITREVSSSGPVTQQVLGHIVETIGERYGSYHDKECANLKTELLHFESKKNGRIRLSDLYVKGFTVEKQFNDRIEYLRDLGVLDESDPKDPLVIVPNYMASRPNCKTVSSFHSVCCRNECEDLVGKLEHQIGEAFATPGRILHFTAKLSSDTVPAPRILSSNLTQYLHTIAESNDGLVPMHGRLFAQWMHHAFPRECPFPNVAHSTTAETPEEWGIKTGLSSQMSREEILNHVDAETVDCLHEEIVNKKLLKNGKTGKISAACLKQPHTDTELPWSNVEELLIRGGSHQPTQRSPGVLRRVFVFGALVSMFWAAKSMVSGTDVSWLDESSSKMV